jgi:hypothetical protein
MEQVGMGWDGMGWDRVTRDGTKWGGMRWDGAGRDGVRQGGMGWDAMGRIRMGRNQDHQSVTTKINGGSQP